jgi:hypothetical protein
MNDKSESHPVSLHHLDILLQRLKTTKVLSHGNPNSPVNFMQKLGLNLFNTK